MPEKIGWWIQTVCAVVIFIALAIWITRYLVMRAQASRSLKKLGLAVSLTENGNRVSVEVNQSTGQTPVLLKKENDHG